MAAKPRDRSNRDRTAEHERNKARAAGAPLLTPEQRRARVRSVFEAQKYGPSGEQVAVMLDAIANGLTAGKAAALARILPNTSRMWLRKGRDELDAWAAQVDEEPGDAEIPDPGMYASFYLDMAEAIAKRELGWLKELHAENDRSSQWQRIAWLLERTAPGDYALTEKVQRLELAAAVDVKVQGVLGVADVFSVLRSAGALAELESGDVPKALPAGG